MAGIPNLQGFRGRRRCGRISERIANPVLNHAQMRELRRIAVHTDFADHDASPYKKDVFKTLSNGEYTAEHLHQARELMKTTAIHDIAFPRDWLKLDSRQMEVVRHALKSDVPMDALEEYADGTYTADHMNVITMALTEGMEKPGIERLMNPRPLHGAGLGLLFGHLGWSLHERAA